MSNFGDHPAGFFGVSGFYNGVATQSLRFDKESSHYLSRTPSSAGNTRTFTFSFWIKKIEVFASTGSSTVNNILSAALASQNNSFTLLRFSNQATGGTPERLEIYNNDNGGSDYSEEANRSFRDPSSWYHIVLAVDTTQGTGANRIKYYVNGVQVDNSTYYGEIPQNQETYINRAEPHNIGRSLNTTSSLFNGYLAEINFVDGTQYDASYFGETKNGIWIPKSPSVTYGTNGYRLQFKQTGTGTASASTIGADTSGNNNHWTSNNLSAHDSNMPDCPENNFCIWSSVSTSNLPALYEGSLKNYGTNNTTCNGTFGVTSGKWYWEIRWLTDISSSASIPFTGVTSYQMENNGDASPSLTGTTGRSVYRQSGEGHDYVNFDTNDRTQTSGGTFLGGAILAFRLDMDNGTLKYYRNNSLQHTDSSIPTDGTVILPLHLNTNSGVARYNSGIANFGQDSSFGGVETAQGNKDENNQGDFYYAVPSGHLALCSDNISDPTIGPNSTTLATENFNTVLYTGNGGTGHAISGVGFQPDWTWIKGRSDADYNYLVDSSRGYTERLFTNLSDAASTEANTVTQADSDGFTVGSDAGVNRNNSTYVAWNWKANGGTTTTNDASSTGVGSIDSVYQANTAAGFSIVTYTGTGSAGTIAHGLGGIPEVMIIKNRTGGSHSWAGFYHHLMAGSAAASATDYLSFDSASVTVDDSTIWNDTPPTSTVFSVGTANNTGASKNYVGYFLRGIEGYSKFGSYNGNDSSDGTFIHTGFRPAWIIVKHASGTAGGTKNWYIYDTTREPINPTDDVLAVNTSSAESSNSSFDIDILSNGFKQRNAEGPSNNAAFYIYLAFAGAPFKYANAH